jgi:competence protein ComEA
MDMLGVEGAVGRGRRAWRWAAAAAVAAALGSSPAFAVGEKVDLNTASLDEPTELPGIGLARARAIIERREETPFRTAEDLREVPGIGDSLYEKLADQIAVSEPAAEAAKAADEKPASSKR